MKRGSEKNTGDLVTVRAHVLRMVAGSTVRVTPLALEKLFLKPMA